MQPIRSLLAASCAAALLLPVGAGAVAEPARAPTPEAPSGLGPGSIAPYHSGDDGHLPPSEKNMELVGRVRLTDIAWGIGDVAALGNWAYLAAYAPECFNPSGPGGGVHIVNLTIPQLPIKTGFIPAGDNTYIGEGVHAFSMNTKHFTGDVLLVSNEPCDHREKANGGISLWDITDPLNPEPLVIGFGDRKPKTHLTAHASHSARAWTPGKRAFVVAVDNQQPGTGDIDIFNITNPRKPKMIAQTGLSKWPRANKNRPATLGTFPASFHHDMWIEKIKGSWYILASYWDTGWVVLNVDKPKKPKFVRDSRFPKRDPITGQTPEGNAHQGVWTNDRKHIIGATEDFFARFTSLTMGSGNVRRGMRAVDVPGARALGRPVGSLSGPTVFGGTGCPPFTVPSASSAFGNLRSGQAPVVALLEGGGCSIGAKLQAANVAGYAAALIATSHESTLFGADPDRLSCPTLEAPRPAIYGFCITHGDFHILFGGQPEFVDPFLAEPRVGALGEQVSAFSFFDGSWGHLRVLGAKKLKEKSVFAIPESISPEHGSGFGTLSVHEVKMDPRRKVNLAYVSWYSGGARVLSINKKGKLRERGHYIGPDGNNFWGVMPHLREGDTQPLVLMSDVNHGLYVLRYTGPGQ